jgi:hypothetical protein
VGSNKENESLEMPGILADYGSPVALELLFSHDDSMSKRAAYILAHRVIQLSEKLRVSYSDSDELRTSMSTLMAQNNGHLERMEERLKGVRQQLDASIQLAEQRRQRVEAYQKFCEDLRDQILVHGFIDGDRFSSGVAYLTTEGVGGIEFKPDQGMDSPGVWRERITLIRELAKRMGFKLIPLASKKSRFRKKK